MKPAIHPLWVKPTIIFDKLCSWHFSGQYLLSRSDGFKKWNDLRKRHQNSLHSISLFPGISKALVAGNHLFASWIPYVYIYICMYVYIYMYIYIYIHIYIYIYTDPSLNPQQPPRDTAAAALLFLHGIVPGSWGGGGGGGPGDNRETHPHFHGNLGKLWVILKLYCIECTLILG